MNETMIAAMDTLWFAYPAFVIITTLIAGYVAGGSPFYLFKLAARTLRAKLSKHLIDKHYNPSPQWHRGGEAFDW